MFRLYRVAHTPPMRLGSAEAAFRGVPGKPFAVRGHSFYPNRGAWTDRRRGAGYWGIETDEDREPGGIGENLLCGLECVGRKPALRVEDCGCGGLSLHVADVQTGGNGRVRIVGVGVIAFLRRHPEYGRRMPVQFGIFRIQ